MGLSIWLPAADLGDQDARPLLVAFQRVVQLGQAVIAELQISRPVGLVERPPRCPDRTRHVLDRSIGRLTGHLFAGRMNDVECRSTACDLQFAVNEHPLVTDQHAGLSLHSRDGRQLYKLKPKCQLFLIPAAWRSWARNWSSSSLRTM